MPILWIEGVFLANSKTQSFLQSSGALNASIDPSLSPANIPRFSPSFMSKHVSHTVLSIIDELIEVKSFTIYKGTNHGYIRSCLALSTLINSYPSTHLPPNSHGFISARRNQKLYFLDICHRYDCPSVPNDRLKTWVRFQVFRLPQFYCSVCTTGD